jgi:hypothetical protein
LISFSFFIDYFPRHIIFAISPPRWLAFMPAPPFSLALFSPDLLAAAIIAAVILMIFD